MFVFIRNFLFILIGAYSSCSDYEADTDLKSRGIQSDDHSKQFINQNSNVVKIMTFNVLSDPLCRDSHKSNMVSLVDFIKNNGIQLAALQEGLTLNDKDCKNSIGKSISINHRKNLQERLDFHLSTSQYQAWLREKVYIHVKQGSQEKKISRFFIHTDSLLSSQDFSTSASNSQGAESIVLNTALGKVRFMNLHPQPGEQALKLGQRLESFIKDLRSIDSTPIIILGDFNLSYHLADAEKVLKHIESLGFYRACDPVRFPKGGCNDTVTNSSGNFAVDHVFIENRSNFTLRRAYVAQDLRFSDHLPVIVELGALPELKKIYSTVSPAGDRALIKQDELGKFKGLGWTIWGEGGTRDNHIGFLFNKPEDIQNLPPRFESLQLTKPLARGLIQTNGVEDRMVFLKGNYSSPNKKAGDYPGATWISELGYAVATSARQHSEFVPLKQIRNMVNGDHAVALEHDRKRFYDIKYTDFKDTANPALPSDLGWIVRKGALGCN